MKSVFATKTELKDKNLGRKARSFLVLNIQDYSPLKAIDDHKKFISINEIDKTTNNLDIKKARLIESTTN